MVKKYTNQEIVDSVYLLLNDNPEWIDRYDEYANSIIKNTDKYKEYANKFRVISPLYAYSCISKVKNNSTTCSYDLRFAGQSIGTITVNEMGEIRLGVTAEQAKCAVENFGYVHQKNFTTEWDSLMAIEYRRCFFRKRINDSTQTHSKEHRIENWMLAELAKKTRKEGKMLCNIQPVRLGGKFFQLATPLSASNHGKAPKYSGKSGGGIDILARVKHSTKDHRLAVIELKDENKESEPQSLVMQQALSYACFLASLLRSKSGEKWWNIFERNTLIPSALHIDAVTLMPEGKSNIGELKELFIKELGVIIHPYTLFYKSDEITGNPTSVYGTLKEGLANKGL